MNPTTNTEAGAVADVAAIARALTKPQRKALIRFDERVHSSGDLHTRTWWSLFEKGLLSDLRAAGYRFFTWTSLGLAVRQHLEQGATADE